VDKERGRRKEGREGKVDSKGWNLEKAGTPGDLQECSKEPRKRKERETKEGSSSLLPLKKLMRRTWKKDIERKRPDTNVKKRQKTSVRDYRRNARLIWPIKS